MENEFEFKEVKILHVDVINIDFLVHDLHRIDAQIHVVDSSNNKTRLFVKYQDRYVSWMQTFCSFKIADIAKINLMSNIEFLIKINGECMRKVADTHSDVVSTEKRLRYSYQSASSLINLKKSPNEQHIDFLISFLDDKIQNNLNNYLDPKVHLYAFQMPNKFNELDTAEIFEASYEVFLQIVKKDWPQAELMNNTSKNSYTIILNGTKDVN